MKYEVNYVSPRGTVGRDIVECDEVKNENEFWKDGYLVAAYGQIFSMKLKEFDDMPCGWIETQIDPL